MYYVYILTSESMPGKTYVGMTNNPDRRLEEHNSGSQIYTRRYAPWKKLSTVSFPSRQKAAAFEKYLKSPSGKAFLVKHFFEF